jgi:hypothetical protein
MADFLSKALADSLSLCVRAAYTAIPSWYAVTHPHAPEL